VKRLEEVLYFKSPRESVSVYSILRVVGVFLTIILLFPVFVVLSLLRFITPILRYNGIRNNVFPTDWVQYFWTKLILIVGGVYVKLEGKSDLGDVYEKGDATIGFFQHSSNLDPFIIMGSSPLFFKFIAKNSIQYVPFIGLQTKLMGSIIPINRGNINSAINSLKHAVDVIMTKGRNIAISPEGTRSPHGQLADFKKGPFHLAYDAKVPITPLIIFGAYNLWPKGQIIFSNGPVVLRFLKPIPAEEYLNKSLEDTSKYIRRKMLEEMAKYPEQKLKVPIQFKIIHFLALGLVYYMSYFTFNYIYFVNNFNNEE